LDLELDIDLQLADDLNHWRKLGAIPKKGPLSEHFKNAYTDWDEIFRLYRNWDTSAIDPSSAPLHQLTSLRSTRLLAFLVHVQDASETVGGSSWQGGTSLFPHLQTLHYDVGRVYVDRFTETGGSWPHFLELGEMLLFDCPRLEKLVISLAPDTSLYLL